MVKNEDENIMNQWIKNSIVSIKFAEIGNPKEYDSKDKLLLRCDEIYADKAPIFRIQAESQIWKFSREINIGDKIVTYRKNTEEFYIAEVTNKYVYIPEVSKQYPNIIKVKWNEKAIPDSNIPKEIRNSLSSQAAVSQIINYKNEIQKLFESFLGDENTQNTIENSVDLIPKVYSNGKSIIEKLKDSERLRLISEIFMKNGYSLEGIEEDKLKYDLKVSYADKLNIINSKVKINILKGEKIPQVKDVNKLISEDEKQVIISTTGFAPSVRDSINKDKVTLIDSKDIVNIMFELYDKFSDELKDKLALKKVYI